ncbi:MAG: prenyltransferase [Candidatus Dormibacteria bacterium]
MTTAALSPADLAATVAAIARVQREDGSIPWFHGGKVDPWDHVEAAMALDVGGRHHEALRAYRWLQRTQRPDGAWAAAYRDGAVVDATLDTNLTAYIATGVWLHLQVTGDLEAVRNLFPCVERALGFVLAMQGKQGEIWWARDAAGRPWRRGLVTGSSSVHLSLACGARLAEALGAPAAHLDRARQLVRAALLRSPSAFEDRSRWAMDWYYPVLGGVVTGASASRRLAEGWNTFVAEGRGVRCVADRPWVTGAETCELALALVRHGDVARAAALVDWAQHLRGDDAVYWTGANLTDGEVFPPDEQPTWTAAAVVLAADAVAGGVTREVLAVTG